MSQFFHLNFIDLDEFIEHTYNRSIPELFRTSGEEGFRDLEAQCLRKTAAFTDTLISCGGGTPCFHNNMEWIKNNGYSIYLKASEDLLFKRLIKEKDGRPLISNMTDAELRTYIKMKLRERDKFYIQADFIASQTENEDISEELKLFLIEKLARDRS